MQRLLKFIALSSGDHQLLLKTFMLLGLVRLGLRLLPFPTLRKVLVSISRVKSFPSKVNQTQVAKSVWAVNQSSRYMPGGVKCLARALTTQVLMSRRGYPAELCIGVAKNETGKLEAHAWIESQGQVLIGQLQDLSRYTLLPSWEGQKL